MSTPREELANLLKQARIAAGYDSCAALARHVKLSRPVVSKAENPTQPVPSDAVLAALAGATGVSLERLNDLAERAKSGKPDWFVEYLSAELAATMIRCWGPLIVPGLLQTEAYARAVLATEPYTPEQLDELLKTRMERHQVLARAYVVAVIDALVLQRCMGSPLVMAEQCAHLVTLAKQPNISLHVVPPGRNVGMDSSFDIATRDGTNTVRMTTIRDVTSTATDMIDQAMKAFEYRFGYAAAPDESIDFVRTCEGQWKEQI